MSKEVKWNRAHYINGQLHWEIPYVNGQMHGIGRSWYKNGQLEYEISYVNGQNHGIARYWKENGKLWSIDKFHRGQKVIDLRFYPIPGDSKMELDLTTNEMSYE
jgi:antitoxin component YwqK of YwqJK toxin-antitoxin module